VSFDIQKGEVERVTVGWFTRGGVNAGSNGRYVTCGCVTVGSNDDFTGISEGQGWQDKFCYLRLKAEIVHNLESYVLD